MGWDWSLKTCVEISWHQIFDSESTASRQLPKCVSSTPWECGWRIHKRAPQICRSTLLQMESLGKLCTWTIPTKTFQGCVHMGWDWFLETCVEISWHRICDSESAASRQLPKCVSSTPWECGWHIHKRAPLICRSTLLQMESLGMLWHGQSRKYKSRVVCIWAEIDLWKLV